MSPRVKLVLLIFGLAAASALATRQQLISNKAFAEPICSPTTFIQDYVQFFDPNALVTNNFTLTPPPQISNWTDVSAWLLTGEWDDCGTLGTFTAACLVNQTFKYPGPKIKIHTGNSPVPGTLTNTQISNASYAFWVEWQGISCVTPTSTPTPSPTPAPTEFQFFVKFEGVTNPATPEKIIRLIFRKPDQLDQEFNITTYSGNVGGKYAYHFYDGSDIKIAPGTYDILTKGPAHLQNKFIDVVIPPQSAPFKKNFIETPLKPGDIAGGDGIFPYDNKVDILDYGVLATNFEPGVTKIALSDLNFDGLVDILDYGLLANNFNPITTGDQ